MPAQRTAVQRVAGGGWLALLGGGEFTFGETVEADRAWMARVGPGAVAFLPTASGSTEYGDFFAAYLREGFDREVDAVPIFRRRDARRGKNLRRLAAAAAVYVGGGVTDHLIEALAEEPALATLGAKLGEGGVVVAIAAAAQACGVAARSIARGAALPGFGWLPGGVVEPNFDPGHDRRLRELLRAPGAAWGLGIPAGSAILLGPERQIEVVGTVFCIEGAEGDVAVLQASAVP
ncbi:MAG: Type 1 glutamine amidotransferase-like domain-containing protein [Acidobacteriota bacterium]|nr:Type 1 glutamine amidotransferase-like domain-containing protein [Acidobacteriota bacterium]MDH3523817.1 Type 1 glutamine amidotransferase-like domain-containing protein [Acidobacteriota bacterium]